MGSSAPQANLFSLLPPARTPWPEFALSITAQIAATACLILIRLLAPHAVASVGRTFHSVRLVTTPAPVNHRPQPMHYLPAVAHLAPALVPVAAVLRLPVPQPKVARTDVAAPAVVLASRIQPMPIHATVVIPRAAVRTNVFSSGSSAIPTLTRTAPQVQTGGFGDRNGVAAQPNQKPVNMASSGSFDLPSGAGHGNGSSPTGVPGVVASAGFGSGTALSPRPLSVGPAVANAGFSNATLAASPEKNVPSGRPHIQIIPAEILSKPLPTYTQEARSLRIEGEVLLEVVLRASGDLRIVRVVHGLGHGLDDNAVKAAEQIRFKPAMKDGQPADSTVVLHVIFQLA